MIEAVGAEYWPAYFAALRRLLAPGGSVALQAITMPHERMLDTARTHTWISKYIFPGGLIPSPDALAQERAAAGLRITHDTGYGDHYAETLRLWRERFLNSAEAVAALGFDHVFCRMWELYLAYSEAGFRAHYLDVASSGWSPPTRPRRAPATTTAFAAALVADLGGAALAVMLVDLRRRPCCKGVHRIVDIAWGVAFSRRRHRHLGALRRYGDDDRRLLSPLATVVWGLRLAVHIARRGRGHGEDPRYARMLARAPVTRPSTRCAPSTSSRAPSSGSSPCPSSRPRTCPRAWTLCWSSASPCGRRDWLSRPWATTSSPASSPTRRTGDGSWTGALGLDPTPQLLRRLPGLVGAVSDRLRELPTCCTHLRVASGDERTAHLGKR